jgi:carbamoyl-phosphate synthase large subunit
MTNKRQIRVLITGSGTVTCQSFIKGLRQQSELDAYVVTTDPNPESAGRYFSNAFYTIPMAKDPQFLPVLTDIIQKERIQLLVPIVDYEFDKIGASKEKFASMGCITAISSSESIAMANEKEKTYKFFKGIGIDTPMTWMPNELPDPKTLSYPVFIKPRTGRASLDVYKINNADELKYYMGLVEDPIFQEYVKGKEYTIDVLSDFNCNVIGVVPRQRVETKVGISYKGRTVDDPIMIEKAKYIAEKLKNVGHCNMQLFVDDNKRYCFFEINPRYSGTLTLTIAAGLNSPYLLSKLALGDKVEPMIGKYEKNLLMLRYWEEVYVRNDGTTLPIPKLT